MNTAESTQLLSNTKLFDRFDLLSSDLSLKLKIQKPVM